MPRLVRGLLALAVGVALVLVVLAHTHGPRLTRVPVLLTNVAPGTAVTRTDLAWDAMATPPPGLATPAQFQGDPVAVIPLRAGQLVTLSDLAPAPGPVATPNEVALTVAVKGAASGLAAPGERVDVWALPAATVQSASSTGSSPPAATPQPTLLLIGARVLTVATANGAPVSGGAGSAVTGGGASGIGLVTLAVPKVAVGAVLAASSVYLVPDATPTQVAVAAQ
jgi:hypothetical protein